MPRPAKRAKHCQVKAVANAAIWGFVIPGKRRSRADPESIEEYRALRWIPGLRFAPPGMTRLSATAYFFTRLHLLSESGAMISDAGILRTTLK